MKGLLSGMLILLFASAAPAQQYTVDERTGKHLTRVQELMEADQYVEARKVLEGMNVDRMGPYEKALLYQFHAFIANGLNDSPGAIRYFEKCLAEDALPPASQLQLRFNLAQLYMGAENWSLAIRNLEQWFAAASEPNAIAYYTLAVAYYQNDQKDKALKPARTAYELEKEPKESWISLLLSIYLEKNDYKNALPLLEDVALRFPNKRYWMQLSAIYAELGMDEKSLAVQQLAYDQGYLSEDSELQRLARMYMFHDLPYRAAQVMERALRDKKVEPDAEALELQGQCWMAAREFDRALEPMAKAASLSDDGALWLRLSQVHVEREDWPEAAKTLRSAIAKGDFADLGTAHLLLGIASYNQQQLEAARAAFTNAAKHSATKTDAGRWLEHLEREAKQGA